MKKLISLISLALAVTTASLVLVAKPQKGIEASRSLVYTEDATLDVPYVTDGLVAMWDAEWNAGVGVHDPEATTWLDLVGGNDMVLNPASVWNDQYLLNAANTIGAVAQHWADDAVTLEVVMRIKGYYKYYNPVFVVYNKMDDYTFRGIGKRYEYLTNCVKHGFLQFGFTQTSIFQASFTCVQVWTLAESYINTEPMSQSRITAATHTIDEDAVYINAGRYEVEYYTIRLYNRALTDAERLFNYETDRQRFNLP